VAFSVVASSPTNAQGLGDRLKSKIKQRVDQRTDIESRSAPSHDLSNKIFPVRMMVDGRYVKAYMDDKRVANAPNANLGRSNKILFKFGASDKEPVFIGNIRVMAGGKKLYDGLAEKQKRRAELVKM
jgi:hypothetical protein